jgi:hypothetical protein
MQYSTVWMQQLRRDTMEQLKGDTIVTGDTTATRYTQRLVT